jgi:SAM-dependent methyltransferase
MRSIDKYVNRYIKNLPDLSGKTVVDIPCGDGRASYWFKEKGATVKAFDLYPEFMKVEGVQAQYADMSERLPIEDASADIVICEEGIEHIPNKPGLLAEFNRILKPNGNLVLTTPNVSHLRARFSMFLLESDLWKRMPPSEIDCVWFSEKQTDRIYFGHLFLTGVHYLRTIAGVSGFEVKQRMRTKISGSSVLLGLFLYPGLCVATTIAFLLYRKSHRKKNVHVGEEARNRVLWEHVKLNLSAKTLFCKHIFWILEKRSSVRESVERLKQYSRECQ